MIVEIFLMATLQIAQRTFWVGQVIGGLGEKLAWAGAGVGSLAVMFAAIDQSTIYSWFSMIGSLALVATSIGIAIYHRVQAARRFERLLDENPRNSKHGRAIRGRRPTKPE